MTDVLVKYRPTLGQIISVTKCDRDKQIFFAEREGQYDRAGHKKGPNGIGKCQKQGPIEWRFSTIFKNGILLLTG